MRLNWLLVFIPIGVGLDWCGANPLVVFLTSALAVVPLAGLMGDATEALARFLGPAVGGLLNATLGNAPEIIICSFALHAGLVSIVKSSLTGSILGNLLFGLGVSFFLGGIKFGRVQRFDPQAARLIASSCVDHSSVMPFCRPSWACRVPSGMMMIRICVSPDLFSGGRASSGISGIHVL